MGWAVIKIYVCGKWLRDGSIVSLDQDADLGDAHARGLVGYVGLLLEFQQPVR
jgi:hypothetical protein